MRYSIQELFTNTDKPCLFVTQVTFLSLCGYKKAHTRMFSFLGTVSLMYCVSKRSYLQQINIIEASSTPSHGALPKFPLQCSLNKNSNHLRFWPLYKNMTAHIIRLKWDPLYIRHAGSIHKPPNCHMLSGLFLYTVNILWMYKVLSNRNGKGVCFKHDLHRHSPRLQTIREKPEEALWGWDPKDETSLLLSRPLLRAAAVLLVATVAAIVANANAPLSLMPPSASPPSPSPHQPSTPPTPVWLSTTAPFTALRGYAAGAGCTSHAASAAAVAALLAILKKICSLNIFYFKKVHRLLRCRNTKSFRFQLELTVYFCFSRWISLSQTFNWCTKS